MSNGGELISLRDQFGNILQSFIYDDDGLAGWPTTPDGGGPSLEYVGPLTAGEDPMDVSPADPFDDPTDWQASAVNGGTPGAGGATPTTDADFDNDALVTGFDFLIWQRNVGAAGADSSFGDANEDAQVDGADLDVWQLQYGSSAPVVAAASSMATASERMDLPTEPTGSHLASLASLLLSPEAEAADTNEVILAEETIDLLFLDPVVELTAPLVPREQSVQDEALSALGSQAGEDESAADDALALLAERAVGLALQSP